MSISQKRLMDPMHSIFAHIESAVRYRMLLVGGLLLVTLLTAALFGAVVTPEKGTLKWALTIAEIVAQAACAFAIAFTLQDNWANWRESVRLLRLTVLKMLPRMFGIVMDTQPGVVLMALAGLAIVGLYWTTRLSGMIDSQPLETLIAITIILLSFRPLIALLCPPIVLALSTSGPGSVPFVWHLATSLHGSRVVSLVNPSWLPRHYLRKNLIRENSSILWMSSVVSLMDIASIIVVPVFSWNYAFSDELYWIHLRDLSYKTVIVCDDFDHESFKARLKEEFGLPDASVLSFCEIAAAMRAATMCSATLHQPTHQSARSVVDPRMLKRAVQIWQSTIDQSRAVFGSSFSGPPDSAPHGRDEAISFNNLSIDLCLAGDLNGALRAAQRAVKICEDLFEEDPVYGRADLALTLNSLSTNLARTGDRAGAIDAIERAIEIKEELAREDFTTHGPSLGLSLLNLYLSNRNVDILERVKCIYLKVVDCSDEPWPWIEAFPDELAAFSMDAEKTGDCTAALRIAEMRREIVG